jgi:hypothetical protein
VERVVEWEQDRRLADTVMRGLPVRNYHAEVTLTPRGSGTHVRWSAVWDRTIPSWIVYRQLTILYPRIVQNLVDAADHETAR